MQVKKNQMKFCSYLKRVNNNQIYLKDKKFLMVPITYVKAAASKIDLQALWYSFGTFSFKIGSALLKLASNSTSSVIRWIRTPIIIDNNVIIRQTLIKLVAPVAKIVGMPIYKMPLPILVIQAVFLTILFLCSRGL